MESESKRIGALQVPDVLLEAMRRASCVRVDLPPALRVALLREEYAHFLDDAEALARQLAPLTALHGKATIERWSAAARAGDWNTLIGGLLTEHYDPTYTRSMERNFPRHHAARIVRPQAIDHAHYRELARTLIAHDAPTAARTVMDPA